MKRIQSLSDVSLSDRGAVAALGNFDGVHLGHQAIIAQAKTLAEDRGAPLAVLTFEPHPRSYFADRAGIDLAPFRLMNPAARASRLEKLGVDLLFEVPFDASLAGLSDEAFAQEVLSDACGLSGVVVGSDFRFGKGRTGDASTLRAQGHAQGFDVKIAEMVQFAGGEVSSTAIRQALAEGRPRDAAAQLGHWHRIEGAVQHGEKRGRELGYPTANLALDGLHLPRLGVYAVVVDVLDGPDAGSYGGVSSIGVRPMFGQNTPNCETFIFDFKGDLYGQSISVGLVSYLRGEEVFDGLDALIAQMDLDSAQARDILAAL